MKHTYTIILAILLVVALAVPAFAAEANSTYTLSGKYQFTENLDPDDYLPTGGWYFYDCKVTYTSSTTGNTLTTTQIGVREDGDIMLRNDATEIQTLLYKDFILTDYVVDGVIDFGTEPQILDYELYAWFTSNAEPYPPVNEFCDGTACPAHDANADDICDECGKMLRLVNTAYPALPSVPGDYTHFVLSKASSGRYDYSVFVSGMYFSARGERKEIYSASFTTPVNIYRYSSTNGGDWVLNVDGATNNTFTVGANGALEILDSSFSWYDEDGTPFFPPPLWEEMGQLTEGEMGALTSQTMRTFSILALCGVGCLALLILLHLLGKKSQIFHL